MSAMIPAGQAIVKLSGQKDGALLEMMRQRLKEAEEAAARLKEEK
jgi:outer membrane biogenesis lipoprotein LolB